MAKLRHIAIASDEPESLASTLQSLFQLAEVGRIDNQFARGVYLTDGTVNIAVLHFRTDQLGRGLDYQGLHHVGFLVGDLAAARHRLDEAGIPCVMEAPEGDTSFFETKFMTPDGFLFDVSVHPWLGAQPLEPGNPVTVSPRGDVPIVCTLDAAAMPERLAAWQRLAHHVVERRDVPDGVQITFAPGVTAAEVADLAEQEHGCCSFFRFSVGIAGGETTLTITAPPDAVEMIDLLMPAS